MTRNLWTAVLLTAWGFSTACLTSRAAGQELERGPAAPPARPAAADDDAYYYSAPPEREKPLTIAQQKSIARAEQRMARLAAMRAYGMSGGRPTASAMAFTTMYSPAWQMPGGRPFAWWHSANRGVVIYRSASAPIYR